MSALVSLHPLCSPHALRSNPTAQREIASCCSTSEWLLWYAQSSRVGKFWGASSNDPSIGVVTGGLSEVPAASAQLRAQLTSALSQPWEIPVKKTSALEPDHTHYTLLREAAQVCERSLSKRCI